jgi:hypothetical protein
MRIPFVALLMLLPACTAGSDWPSLARRPGESAPLPSATAPDAAVAASNAASGGVSSVIAGRMVEASREIAAVAKRWQRQQAATASAVAAAQGAADSSEGAVKAQLELSRLDRIGAQISDLRTRLDAIGGDMALTAADGQETGAALRELGGLIGTVEALRTDHLAAVRQLRAK